MDTAISGLIVISLLILTVFTVSYGYLNMQNGALATWSKLEQRAYSRARTDLQAVSASTNGSGDRVELALRNTGETRLADFDRWDVIVEYDATTADYVVDWLARDDLASPRWWSVQGIYQDYAQGQGEVFEANILNATEEIVIHLWLSPSVGITTTNRATIVTEKGIVATAIFTR
jgi:archaellum component FlaF (FlaF/FlaG flagellin family)